MSDELSPWLHYVKEAFNDKIPPWIRPKTNVVGKLPKNYIEPQTLHTNSSTIRLV